MKLQNYAMGEWIEGNSNPAPLFILITGEQVAEASSGGLNFEEMLNYGRVVRVSCLKKNDLS